MPLLHSLSGELKQLSLWSDIEPPQEYLLSTQPFCCDCLPLEQWLQFVFIPKILDMLKMENIPCFQCGISPIAEESFKKLDIDSHSLLNVIKGIDNTISGNVNG